jgi:MFS transporter, Spinster family, sphingosine-1-phosphate transporter
MPTPLRDSLYTFFALACKAWLGIILCEDFPEFTSFSTWITPGSCVMRSAHFYATGRRSTIELLRSKTIIRIFPISRSDLGGFEPPENGTNIASLAAIFNIWNHGATPYYYMFRNMTRDQRVLLIVLTLINFFNYVDRQIIFPLFGSIKAEFHVTDFQLGLLGTLFMIVHSLASLPLGILADRWSRKGVIVLGVTFWSVVTFASGLAQSFRVLLGIRSLVGIGEASYAPAATAMISDNFPERMRAQVQGVFNAGMFVGGTLGVILSGIIVYYVHSWRLAFFLVAIPGFILAYAATRIKETELPIQHEGHISQIKSLLKNPAYVWMLISGTLVTFAAGAYIAWGVEFVSRYKGFSIRDTSIFLGADMMVAGILGVFLGSYLADKLQEKVAWGRSFVVGASLLCASPFMFLGLADSRIPALFFVYFFFGTALLSFYHGPATAVIHDLVPTHVRATAFAAYLLVVHLLGDGLAPAAVGFISDRHGLKVGLQFSTALVTLSGLAFIPIVNLIRKKKVILFTEENNVHAG